MSAKPASASSNPSDQSDFSLPASFLLRHFSRLAEAPGGLAKLRALVLQLAITGKLLPQSKADESATKLLARIRSEKALITKKSVSLSPIDRSEVEIEIPAEWEWIKLGDLCSKTGSGSTPRGGKTAYTTSGIPFLRSQNVYDDGLRLDSVAYITPEIHAQMSGTAVVPDDLLLNITGGSIGRCAIVPGTFTEGNVSQHVAILRPAIPGMSGFLHLVVLSPHFQTVMLGSQTGAGREGLPKNRMDEILIPLPPLAEQRRIVAKVEELMGLCDALEAAQQEREAVRTRLRTSALHQLTSPDSDSKSAAFVFQNLQLFTAAPEDFDDIRQSVLQLAIEGKLSTEKSGEDGDALLQQIRNLKLALIASRKAPKEKPAEPIDASAVPFEIPASWTWTRVAWISAGLDYGTSEKSERSNLGVPVVSMGNLQNGRILLENLKRVPDSTEGLPELYLEAGDILFNRTNSAELVGKTGIYEGQSKSFTFASYLIRLRLVTEFADPRFVIIATNAPYFRASQIAPEIVQQCGQANVNGTKLANFLIPLPPLAEQRRIVAKVDEVMAVLDALETTLTTARTTAEKLLDATIAKLHAA